MKRFLFYILMIATAAPSCSLELNDQRMVDMTLPKTYSPRGLVGEWASNYSSLSQVIGAYEGRQLDSAWQSGKYFKITDDGRHSEAYFMDGSPYASAATKVVGTIRFDVGATAESGSFTFLALKAHYHGWGSAQVNRDANETELKTNLTGKYYYHMENGVLFIEGGNKTSSFSSSFNRL